MFHIRQRKQKEEFFLCLSLFGFYSVVSSDPSHHFSPDGEKNDGNKQTNNQSWLTDRFYF